MKTNPMTLALLEKAKVIGHIDLPKDVGRPTQKPGFITKGDLNALEKVLDKLFAHYNIDIEFTSHFKDQVNLSRNKKQITIEELSKMFRKVHTKFGGKLRDMKDREAVLVDLQSKINVPFVLKHDKNGDIDLVSKTVMRKADFKTSNQKLKVEMLSFKQYIKEAMQPEEFLSLAQDAVDFLKNELTRMFPGQQVVCHMSKNLGPSMVVAVYTAKKSGTHLDMLNSKANAQFMMHLTNGFGRLEPLAKFSFSKNSIHVVVDASKTPSVTKKIAYRKISGKTPMDASKKLLAWFKKNKADFTLNDANAI